MKYKVKYYEESGIRNYIPFIFYNHFDCPVCKTERAPTSIYAKAKVGRLFECRNCGCEFIIEEIHQDGYWTITYKGEV